MRVISAFSIGVALTLCVGAPFAADLPSKKAAPAPVAVAPAPPAFSWSGFYAGLNAGYDWGGSANLWSVNSATIASIPGLQAAVNAAGSQKMSERGAAIGGQIGYLWQATPLALVGVEVNVDRNGLRGGQDLAPQPIPGFAGSTFTDSQGLQATWTAGLRARLGVTPTDGLMVYGLGGFGVAGIRYSSVFNDTFNEYEAFQGAQVKAGWTMGGGVEYALSAQLSARAEYAYSRYGAITGTGSTLLTDGTTAVVSHSSGTLKVNSFRVGLNYRFGN